MKLSEKLKSRKLWAAGAGVTTGVVTDNPLLSVVIAAIYIVVEGLVDALHKAVKEKTQ